MVTNKETMMALQTKLDWCLCAVQFDHVYGMYLTTIIWPRCLLLILSVRIRLHLQDYVQVIRELGPLADYIVVNISSPNTPGLRDLQQQDPLRQLLQSVIEERNKLPSRYCGKRRGIVQGKDIPLLVKIAPDLTGEEMKDIADVVRSNRNTNDNGGVDGLVVCNTTISRPDWLISTKHKHEAGGLSGAPLKALSTSCIRTMYKLTNGEVPIIGVGGISSGEDVYEKLRAGASLVQLYSAMAYEGPGLVSRIQDELEELMIQNGDKSVDDIIGLDHEEIYWNRQQKQLVQQQQQQQTTA
jgi:dihydroorotate dehydrogenase